MSNTPDGTIPKPANTSHGPAVLPNRVPPNHSHGPVVLPKVTSNVTVETSEIGGFSVAWNGGESAVMPVHHMEFNQTDTASQEVSGAPGVSCWLVWHDNSGGTHSSGDNFTMGDQNVRYSLWVDPFQPWNGVQWNKK